MSSWHQYIPMYEMGDLNHSPIARYRWWKLDKKRIFSSDVDVYRKATDEPLKLKLMWNVGLSGMFLCRNFQLNRVYSCWDIESAKWPFWGGAFYGALIKNTRKSERYNIFWNGLRQAAQNTCLYHISHAQAILRACVEHHIHESAVAYMEWLIDEKTKRPHRSLQ